MAVPCVLFDLDNTILDFSAAEEKALKKAFLEAGITADTNIIAHFRQINERCWQALERGEMTRTQVLYGRFEQLFRKKKLDIDPVSVQNRYEQHLCSGHYFMPGAENMLDSLCERYRLFVVSNGNASTQAKRIASAGLATWFEDFFISETIGKEKPSAAFFDYCFSHMPGADRSSAIIVGDSLTSDILGGYNAGIATVWLNVCGRKAAAPAQPDYIISCLADLPPLLDKHFMK